MHAVTEVFGQMRFFNTANQQLSSTRSKYNHILPMREMVDTEYKCSAFILVCMLVTVFDKIEFINPGNW